MSSPALEEKRQLTVDDSAGNILSSKNPPKSTSSVMTEKFPLLADKKKKLVLGKDFYMGICQRLKENAIQTEGLDIYQITSFLKYYHIGRPDYSKSKYLFYCCKSLICCSIQTFGMGAFLYNLWSDPDNEIVCTMKAAPELRILATLFSLYISVQMIGQIRVLKSDGLYEHVAYAPKFLANEWIYLGLYSNFFGLVFAIYGSFLVIYIADNALDIILNSVALYFILDIDNLMVDHFDYRRIEEWFEKEFVYDDYFDEDWYNTTEGDVRFVDICGMHLQVSGRQGGCNMLKLIWVFLGGFFVYLTIVIGVAGAVIAPIAIAICY